MTDRDRFDEQPQTTQPIIPEPLPPAFQPIPVAQTASQTKFQQAKKKIGKMHLFSAFCENPDDVSFQTQEPDEIVLLFLRKSQIINFPWIAMTAVLLIVPFIIYASRSMLGQLTPPLSVDILAVILYYLLVATYAFINFISWYYNAAIVTNKRVIDIDFHQLVFKDVAETKLALVQDVSYQQVGALQNLFGYGHILIQTAGTLDNFEFYGMPQPARIVEIVESLIGGRRMYEP